MLILNQSATEWFTEYSVVAASRPGIWLANVSNVTGVAAYFLEYVDDTSELDDKIEDTVTGIKEKIGRWLLTELLKMPDRTLLDIMLYHIWSMHVMELLIWLSKRVPYLLKVNISFHNFINTSAATTTTGLEVETGGLEFWIFSKL